MYVVYALAQNFFGWTAFCMYASKFDPYFSAIQQLVFDLFKFDHLSTCCVFAAILTSGTQAMPYHSSTFAGSEIRYWHNVGNQLIYDHNLRKNMWRCETLSHVASGWFIEFLWAGASPLSCFYCLAVNKNFPRWNFDLLHMYPPKTKFIRIDLQNPEIRLENWKTSFSLKSMFLYLIITYTKRKKGNDTLLHAAFI